MFYFEPNYAPAGSDKRQLAVPKHRWDKKGRLLRSKGGVFAFIPREFVADKKLPFDEMELINALQDFRDGERATVAMVGAECVKFKKPRPISNRAPAPAEPAADSLAAFPCLLQRPPIIFEDLGISFTDDELFASQSDGYSSYGARSARKGDEYSYSEGGGEEGEYGYSGEEEDDGEYDYYSSEDGEK